MQYQYKIHKMNAQWESHSSPPVRLHVTFQKLQSFFFIYAKHFKHISFWSALALIQQESNQTPSMARRTK
jgi:hypothetical protein